MFGYENDNLTGVVAYAIIGVMFCCAGVSAVQQEPDAEGALDVGRPPATADPAGGPAPDVYVLDSFEADELIADAVRQAAREQWIEASRILLRVLDQYPNVLARIESGRYTSVPARVNQLVADWPDRGREAYEAVAGPIARDRLSQVQNDRRMDGLAKVADRYFCTLAGADACDLIGQLATEAGDFASAVSAYRRVLSDHPGGQRLQSRFATRLAITYALWGRVEDARNYINQAGRDAAVEWMGERRNVADLVETLLRDTRPRSEPPEAFAWPTFCGNYSRTGAVALDVDQLAVMWEVDQIGEAATIDESDRSSTFRRALERGKFLSSEPVLERDALFVHDGRSVYALQAGSGRRLWRYAGLSDEVARAVTSDTEVPRWHGLTVADGRVYACLGSEFVPFYGYEVPENTSALFCLDAETGDETWRLDQGRLGEDFKEMSFESSPIVQDGRVYAVARRKRAFGFEDCFCYTLDAATGAVESRVHLGSASTGGFGYRRATLTIPSLSGQSVYIGTNLGTVAAVDRHTGWVRWLRLYERISESQWRRMGRGDTRELNPWHYSPVVCSDGAVYVLPTDSEHLLVFDEADGRVLHQVPIDRLLNVQTILGVSDGLVFGVGDEAFCYDVRHDELVWHSPFPQDGERFGRGALTAESVLVPTRASLCVFDRLTGAVSAYPWSGEQGGGNLLVMPGQLIVAGSDRITAYARKADVLARLRDQMDASPDDPAPALELAEVLFRAGDVDAALQTLDEAVARAGGFAGAMNEDIRRRLFDDCLTFAGELSEGEGPDYDRIIGLYERASKCPPDTQAHLVYRLRWAKVYEDLEQWADAVALYQQIVADRSLAGAPVPGDDDSSAGAAAEAAIAGLIDEHGRDSYSRFDAAAANLLSAGVSAGDERRLARVAEAFPNSVSAPAALEARAELLRAGGDYAEAARCLATILIRYPGLADAPNVMRSIADCHRDAGRPAHAWAWLTKAAREHPTATIKVNGTPMTLLQYRDSLGDLRAQVEPARPKLAPPVTGEYQREFEQPFELLEPRAGHLPGTDWRTFVTYSEGQVSAFEASTNKPLWVSAGISSVRPDLLRVTAEQMIFATRYRVFALNAVSGELAWEIGGRPPGLDDPAADPEDFTALLAIGVTPDRLFIIDSDARATAIDSGDGRLLWQHELEHGVIGPLTVNDTWMAYPTLYLGQPACAVISAADGTAKQLIEARDGGQIARTFLTLEDTVILVTAEAIQCHDLVTGQQRWFVQRDGGILTGSAALDLDGLYVSDDGQHIEKLSLNDGRVLWRSENTEMSALSTDGATLEICDGQVLLSALRRVVAYSAQDGRILWEGTVRRGVRFRTRFVADAYVVAIDSPPERFHEQHTAFLYDLRNASGMIPSDGGIKPLGVTEEAKHITIRDGALLLQTENAVHGWTSQQADTVY